MNTRLFESTLTAAIALTLGACVTTPDRNDELETARAAVEQVRASPVAGEYAADEVTAAHEALREADRLTASKGPKEDIRQMAYMAKRHADIASQQIARGQSELRAKEAEDERERAVLEARQQEAQERERTAQLAAEQSKLAADQSKLTAEQAQRDADMLKEQLRELQAKQTDRGLVLTLGDVLFDTGQATLKPGATGTIQRLAQFLQQSPDRGVTIEGHTDSVGSDSYNMTLSESRASAVRTALTGQGVPAERITSLGKGEAVPVAGNESAAGRQQNRRVEIIVSNAPAVAVR